MCYRYCRYSSESTDRSTIGTVDIALKVLTRYSFESTDRSTIGTVDIALKVLIE